MKILAVGTTLLLLGSLICGVWIRSQSQVDQGSIAFHKVLGILTVLAGVATSVALIAR